MSDVISCPECGATSPSGSTWCTLCFAKFDDGSAVADETLGDLAPDGPPDAPPAAPAVDLGEPVGPGGPPAKPGEQLSFIDDDTPTWQCRFCGTQLCLSRLDLRVGRPLQHHTLTSRRLADTSLSQRNAALT